MTVALVTNKPGFNTVKKQYKKVNKDALLVAIEKAGGMVYLQVHGPSISVLAMDGNTRQQYNGNGAIHEMTYDQVSADKVSPYLVQSIVAYLEAIEKGTNDFEMVYRRGSSNKMKKFDVYTKDTIMEAYRTGIVGGQAVSANPVMR